MDTPKEPTTEELPKEELLKKYKKLLLIARQAKQAKDESTDELRKSKESEKKLQDEITILQEVLQSSAAKQAELAEAENKIKILSAQNAELKKSIQEIEGQNKALKKTVDTNAEQVDFLEERILKDAEKMSHLDAEKNSLEALNQELQQKLAITEEKYKLVEKSLTEFKEKYLEEKQQYATLETVLNKLEEKSEKSSSERSESRNGLQTVPETHELEEAVVENEKHKTRIEALTKELEKYKIELSAAQYVNSKQESLYRNIVTECLSQVDYLKETVANVDSDFEKIAAEKISLNTALLASTEKLSTVEKQLTDFREMNESLRTELESQKEHYAVEATIFKQDIHNLQEALSQNTSENDAEKMQEILKYQAVIEKLTEELHKLREENQQADDKFTELQNRLKESTRVSEQLEVFVNSRCEEYDNLKLKTAAYDRILPVFEKLRNDLKNSKTSFNSLKLGVNHDFADWITDQKQLEHNLLRFVEDNAKKIFDNNTELLKEMNLMNQELKERGEAISKLEESNASLLTEANDSKTQIKKLSGQVASAEGDANGLRHELEARDRVVRDLEEEINRLRMNEGDTLSTSTISRVEESQRLVELDQSFEEKYNKLKILAAKLKKKATELQGQLEQEREKVNRERTEFQNKIAGFQNQAKLLNSLQSDYDSLFEKSEKDRKEGAELRKGLKKACDENVQLKQLVDELKSEHSAFKHEKSSFEIIKKELYAQIQALKKTVEREQGKVKEWDKERERLEQEQAVILKKLDEEKGKHKASLQLLDEEKQKQKKQSLLSLEMADYERTVTELSKKLDTKEAQISELLASLDTQRELSSTLQATVAGLESRVSAEQAAADFAKSRQNVLQDELTALRQELTDKASQASDSERTFHERTLEFDALKLENSNIATKNVKLEEKVRVLQESTKTELRNLEEKRNQLQAVLERRELELEELKQEFEKYKVRAQNVLRQSQRDGSLSKQQNIEEEVVQLRASCDSLRAKLDDTVKRLQQTTEDYEKAVEERSRVLKKVHKLQSDNSELNAQNAQLQAAEQKAREQYEESARLLPVQQETLAQCFKREMEELELKHRAELETVRTAQQQAEMALSLHVGRQTPQSHRRQPSTGSSDTAHRRQPSTSFMPVKPEREALDVLMLEREACEGSESVDSSSPKILPLEQLLSPQPAHSINSAHLAAKLEKSENRIQHLTSLLSDAESDAARLQQLNQVLKEEIRRKERNVAREEHSDNLEYLKNIVVKFGTLPRGDERLRLVPVLNTILKFSKEEEQRMYAAARGDANAAGWGSYLGGIWSGAQ